MASGQAGERSASAPDAPAGGAASEPGLARASAATGEPVPAGAAEPDLHQKKVYEAGGVIVFGDKIVLRLTDEQNWIFPKGKLKKHERPEDAAIREAVEETGLQVELVGEAGELIMKADGKKRRFVFYLMRATGTTWDWPHHQGRDTFLMSPERVASLLKKGYRQLWAGCQDRARDLAALHAHPDSDGDHTHPAADREHTHATAPPPSARDAD
jgi:8-oxo-dGTP pyrophosphatase MutT (NUDIX family)